MRIGELARQIGVSTDTVQFYERSGWLPRASRRGNTYPDYDAADVEHLRLLVDLRRLDIPPDATARIAGWCHAGHCAEASDELPALIGERRSEIAERIAGLQALDARLSGLERHLRTRRRTLAVLGPPGPCCDAAMLVDDGAAGTCACCSASA